MASPPLAGGELPPGAASAVEPAATSSLTAEDALTKPLEEVPATMTSSHDDPKPTEARAGNGAYDGESGGQEEEGGGHEGGGGREAETTKADGEAVSNEERVRKLEEELARTREDKEIAETQYKSLLGKLTTMRNTLGERLRQDAEELDRREQLVSSLQAQNEDLTSTIDALTGELETATSEAERASRELSSLRSSTTSSAQRTAEDLSARETALKELQEEVERMRIEGEEAGREAEAERVRREEMEDRMRELERLWEDEKAERERLKELWEADRRSAENLQAVLEEFEAAKDSEIQQALGDHQARYENAMSELARYKGRTSTAEGKLAKFEGDVTRAGALEQEVKEKNLLIGKLRHEAVILNEHLTEALRRLRRDSSDVNVDRRLVTNIVLQFLATPRADPKRFEMLSLLASILSWSETEREQAGLVRTTGTGGVPISPGVRLSANGGGAPVSPGGRKAAAGMNGMMTVTDEESFSNAWVEFLLKESGAANAAAGAAPGTAAGVGAMKSPLSPSATITPSGATNRRASSSSSSGATRSPPPPPLVHPSKLPPPPWAMDG